MSDPASSPHRSLQPTLLGVSAALILFGASTPAVAQGLPRFAFPSLAALGGSLILVSLVRSVRRWRRERRVGVGSLAINLVAVVAFVVLPLTHLARAFVPPRDGTPRIHTGYHAWVGAEGYPRWGRHRGIDVAGTPGADVLAAADGRVTVARDNRDLCGLIVVIDHDPHGLRTVYCHFSEIAVRVGDTVARGQRIGAVGTSGQRAWPPVRARAPRASARPGCQRARRSTGTDGGLLQRLRGVSREPSRADVSGTMLTNGSHTRSQTSDATGGAIG